MVTSKEVLKNYTTTTIVVVLVSQLGNDLCGLCNGV